MKRLALRLLALGAAEALERIDPYQRLHEIIEHSFGAGAFQEFGVIHRETDECGACGGFGTDCTECFGLGRHRAPYTFADWIGDLLGGDGP